MLRQFSGTMLPSCKPAIYMSNHLFDNPTADSPIGVFDSGVGGLTVLHAIRQQLPAENLVYLGDTARLPYGTKSARSVARYAAQAARHLQGYGIKLLVVACNTASAVALRSLCETLAPLPVIGVVEPGARAAVDAVPGGQHLVLATEATVALGAYSSAIRKLDERSRVDELACELLVALAEEGWTSGSIAENIVHQYLDRKLQPAKAPNSIILGCTHFPLLREAIRAVVGDSMSIVDSASTTAMVVASWLRSNQLAGSGNAGRVRLLATDGARRFARVGGAFLGDELAPGDIELVDL